MCAYRQAAYSRFDALAFDLNEEWQLHLAGLIRRLEVQQTEFRLRLTPSVSRAVGMHDSIATRLLRASGSQDVKHTKAPSQL